MNTQEIEIGLLADGELEQVFGGMDCAKSIAVSRFYNALASIYSGMGMTGDSMHASGVADGMVTGGCGK